MYYCNDCGEFMSLPGMGETGADVCLYCGSEDIEDAGQCGGCGEPIKSSSDYCPDCMSKAVVKIGELAKLLKIDRATAKDLLYAVMERED